MEISGYVSLSYTVYIIVCLCNVVLYFCGYRITVTHALSDTPIHAHTETPDIPHRQTKIHIYICTQIHTNTEIHTQAQTDIHTEGYLVAVCNYRCKAMCMMFAKISYIAS